MQGVAWWIEGTPYLAPKIIVIHRLLWSTMVTTIQIDEKVKARLDSLKTHRRESFNELISRLIESVSSRLVSRDTLIETL